MKGSCTIDRPVQKPDNLVCQCPAKIGTVAFPVRRTHLERNEYTSIGLQRRTGVGELSPIVFGITKNATEIKIIEQLTFSTLQA